MVLMRERLERGICSSDASSRTAPVVADEQLTGSEWFPGELIPR